MCEQLEARGGIEPPIEVLQTSALPLGDRAPPPYEAQNWRFAGAPDTGKPGELRKKPSPVARVENLERETGFEPATSTLARSHSTTELLPLEALIITNL